MDWLFKRLCSIVYVDYHSPSIAYYDIQNSIVVTYDLSENLDYQENGLTLDMPADVDERRFWGWSCGEPLLEEIGQCWRYCCYYIFWMENGCGIYGCGDEPCSRGC